ncbi:MAG TPA: hypothetical protein VM366_07390 [Anaerolineae bacterium]|nr:hypothetical protein [Anaerolineae bacterium]
MRSTLPVLCLGSTRRDQAPHTPGGTTIRARAIRIGYGESEERVAAFRVTT